MSVPPHKPESAAEPLGSDNSASTTPLEAPSTSTSREDACSRLLARLSIPSLGPADSEITTEKTVSGDEHTKQAATATLGQSVNSSTPEPDVQWAQVLSTHAQYNHKWSDLREWFINDDLDDDDRLTTVRRMFGLCMTNLKLSELAEIPTEGEYEHERLRLISAFVTCLNLPIEKLSLDGTSEGAPLVDILEPREVLGPFVCAVYTVSRTASDEEDEEKRELLPAVTAHPTGWEVVGRLAVSPS